jgi:hypothetical protein
MARNFVAINDWCHRLLRDIVRQAPLCVACPDGGLGTVEHCVRPEDLPEAYYSLAAYHTLQGFSMDEARAGRWPVRGACKPALYKAAGGLDATRLDRRCWGDLRLRADRPGAVLVAGELLVYGAGMLRCCLNSGQRGTKKSELEAVFRRIVALHSDPDLSEPRIVKRAYYSTNLIYGDAFGQLEQLWECRADTVFLDYVARSLEPYRAWGSHLVSSVRPPLNAEAVLKLHLGAQSVWKAPPGNARALLRRLEFILEHTIIDSSGVTLPGGATPGRDRRTASGWDRDRSGYDGWFPETGPALN